MPYQIKMTEERKQMFRDMGHEESDMRQLSEALKRTKYKISSREEGRTTPISAVQALEILGEKKFLSGISRSAYHYTAARETEDGKFVVYFDSSMLFR